VEDMRKTRKPTHPGIILDEHYIKPLSQNIQELADNLGVARNTLYKIRSGKTSITPNIAVRLAEAFDTTPGLWLNMQQKYDLWVEQYEKTHKKIIPVFRADDDCDERIAI
jgi:addiction module HigA family antidote